MDYSDKARLLFLIRTAKKELENLTYSQNRVFKQPFTIKKAQSLETDQQLAEKVEAFVSRFCRFQDMLGDKLLPHWLKLLGEINGSMIDNLDKAEKFNVLASTDDWLAYRQLRNQMIHEYIEDMTVFTQAIQSANTIVPILEAVLLNVLKDIEKRKWL